MNAPARSDAPRELAEIGRRALGRLRRSGRHRDEHPAHAPFDPVRVEAEFYDAIYGRRTGTVENIGPLDAARAKRPAAR
jgi:hypothetical protein